MSRAPEEIIEWTKDVEKAVDVTLKSLGYEDEALQEDISESGQVLEQEKHTLEITHDIEDRAERINSSLDKIMQELGVLKSESDGSVPDAEFFEHMKKGNLDGVSGFQVIKEDLSTINSELDEVVDETRTEVNEAESELTDLEQALRGNQDMRRRVERLSTMVESISQMARDSGDNYLREVSERLQNKLQSVEEALERVEEDETELESGIEREIRGLDEESKEIIKTLKEMSADHNEIREMAELLGALAQRIRERDGSESRQKLLGQLSNMESYLELFGSEMEAIENKAETLERLEQNSIHQLEDELSGLGSN